MPDLNGARTGPADGGGGTSGGGQTQTSPLPSVVTDALGNVTQTTTDTVGSITGPLLSRLNPFRAAGKRAAKRGGGR